MNYQLIKEIVELVETFDTTIDSSSYSKDMPGFTRWICDNKEASVNPVEEPAWEGKENGRTPESVINTLIVHINRYAKTYSKSAIHDSDFSTQEDFIYLITLRAFGEMTKMDLIRKNIHDKPLGIQIINRLTKQGWIKQKDSPDDKRSKIISISGKGKKALDHVMRKIRQATEIVTGNLSHKEKMQLITLLQKLERFHQPIYSKNLNPSQLVDIAHHEFRTQDN